jgi:hypothetical protein
MIAVSLFDMSGNMVRPLAEEGWECYCYDIQSIDRLEIVGKGKIIYLSDNLLDISVQKEIIDLAPTIIFAFPPCTDLAVSGARHFETKKLSNPLYRQEAMSLVYIARDIAESVGCPYMIENPVSVISSEWRKPDFIFHPYEYGGYLPEDDIHPEWPDYIAARDAYTKKTCLWTGGGFDLPEKLPLEKPNNQSAQHLKLGGKSLKTKNIRSATPRGFAKAVSLQILGGQWIKKL